MGRYKLRSRNRSFRTTLKHIDLSDSDDESDDEDSDELIITSRPRSKRLYCICKQPQNKQFMIRCFECDLWFHGECVNVTEEKATEWKEKSKMWSCPDCQPRIPGISLRQLARRAGIIVELPEGEILFKNTIDERALDMGEFSTPGPGPNQKETRQPPIKPRRRQTARRSKAPPIDFTASESSMNGTAEEQTLNDRDTSSTPVPPETCKPEKVMRSSENCIKDDIDMKPNVKVLEESTTTTTTTASESEEQAILPATSTHTFKFGCCNCNKWPMLIPVYQCFDGHPICSPCSAILTICQTCGLDLPDRKIRAPAIEALQPDLTKCDQVGCKEVFANQSDLKEHLQTNCLFKKLPICKILGLGHCGAVFRPGDVAAIEHLKIAHGAEQVQTVNDQIGSSSNYFQPSISCVAHLDNLVIIKKEVNHSRRQVQIFAFGERSQLQKLTFHMDTKFQFDADQVQSVDNIHIISVSAKLLPFVAQKAETYKAWYTFDVGSALVHMNDCVWRIDTVE